MNQRKKQAMNIDQIMTNPSSMFKTSTFNRFFLGGLFSSKKVKHKAPKESVMGKWASDGMLASINSGMAGNGVVPSQLNAALAAYGKSYSDNAGELESNLDRFVPQNDTKVRSGMRGALARSNANTIQGLKEQDATDLYGQKLEAMGLGMDFLNTKKGVAQQIADVQNQGEVDAAGIGTFMDGIVGGVTGAVGYKMGQNNAKGSPMQPTQTGQQNYAQQWNGAQGNGGSNFNAAPDGLGYQYGSPQSYDKATKWDSQYMYSRNA